MDAHHDEHAGVSSRGEDRSTIIENGYGADYTWMLSTIWRVWPIPLFDRASTDICLWIPPAMVYYFLTRTCNSARPSIMRPLHLNKVAALLCKDECHASRHYYSVYYADDAHMMAVSKGSARRRRGLRHCTSEGLGHDGRCWMILPTHLWGKSR